MLSRNSTEDASYHATHHQADSVDDDEQDARNVNQHAQGHAQDVERTPFGILQYLRKINRYPRAAAPVGQWSVFFFVVSSKFRNINDRVDEHREE